MSGILRSSLRLVNTAKYAINNSTQYLRTMVPPNNVNPPLALRSPDDVHDYRSVPLLNTQADMKTSNNFWKAIKASMNNMIPIFANKLPDKEEKLLSSLGNFIALQSSGKIGLITKKKETNFIFPAVFISTTNRKLVEPQQLYDTTAASEKIPISFRAGGLNLLLDGNKLKFKVEDSDETFIMNHTVYVKAFRKPQIVLKNGMIKDMLPLNIQDVMLENAKLTLKTPKSQPEHRFYEGHYHRIASVKQYDGFGDYGTIVEPKKTTKLNVTDADKPGRVQLQFPMTLSLQGFKQKIRTIKAHETITIYHKVDLECFKESNKENEVADKIKNEKRSIGKFKILLKSGDLRLGAQDSSYPGLHFSHQVSIEINLDDDVPFIDINPLTVKEYFTRD